MLKVTNAVGQIALEVPFFFFFISLSLSFHILFISIYSAGTKHSNAGGNGRSLCEVIAPEFRYSTLYSVCLTIPVKDYRGKKVMANQDEGWPLGLRPLNARVGLMRNREFSAGSASFSTLVTGSLTSTASSDLDTESTASVFHDNGITLGSLIGVSSIFDLSRRSSMGRRTIEASKNKKNCKTKHWLFSLCSKLTPEDVDGNTPSLGHFLEAERRGSSNINRRNHSQSPIEYGPDDFSAAVAVSDSNRLFVDGVVAAAQTSSASQNAENIGRTRSHNELVEYGNGFRTPLLVPCLCGQLIK